MDEVSFGRYRLIELIGQGSMGQVYRAHDTVIGRDVAVKILPVELGLVEGYRERFRREAHTAARLTEPHIIPIHDTGEIDGRLYLVMPVIDGQDLSLLLKQDGPIPPARAVGMIEQLASALDTAHAAGLVHRDVKPSNALVTGRDFVYLIDFGIAHDEAGTKLTQAGSTVGTLAYMAPERFTAGVVDARADVYALACVLHECLTGLRPYPGSSVEQQITGHLTLPVPAPSRLNSAVPGGFDEVIALGMAKDPEQRYQSAAELARAARDALSAPPTPGPTPTTAGPPADPTVTTAPSAGDRAQQTVPLVNAAVTGPRPAAAEPAPAVGAPMWGGGGAWPGGQPPPLLPPPPPPAAPGEHNRWRVLGIATLVVAVVVAVLTAGAIYYAINHSTKPAPTTTTAPRAAPRTATTALPGSAVTTANMDALLLTDAEINTTMGTTTMKVIATVTTLGDNNVSPPECLPLAGALQSKVYAGSGWVAAHGRALREPSDQYPHVFDGVVLFPSAQRAAAFFTASSKSWPACANLGYTFIDDTGQTEQRTVGPVSVTNDTISATNTTEGGNGLACQHALTASNNVVIETLVCAYKLTDQAVRIAQQVAAKVPRP